MTTLVSEKVMSLAEAIDRFVFDRDKVAIGLSLENLIPFAAGHEIIRRGKKDLTLIGPISDILFDQLIAAGVVQTVMAAWVGNVSTGVGYNFRRAVESGQVKMIDYTNYSLCLALNAAANGLPCALTKSLMGTDVLKNNPNLKLTACPFTGQRLVAVRALHPDVAIIHVQKADAEGNIHLWGPYGLAIDGAKAAKRVIVVCEELVAPEEIRADPNRCLLPGFLVSAVVVEPWGAHPSGVQGYYGHDDAFYVEYARRTRDVQQAREWQAEWIGNVADRGEYLKILGPERIRRLRVSRLAPSPAVEFGY
jgi:glutaconate CoA-transferase subunit A